MQYLVNKQYRLTVGITYICLASAACCLSPRRERGCTKEPCITRFNWRKYCSPPVQTITSRQEAISLRVEGLICPKNAPWTWHNCHFGGHVHLLRLQFSFSHVAHSRFLLKSIACDHSAVLARTGKESTSCNDTKQRRRRGNNHEYNPNVYWEVHLYFATKGHLCAKVWMKRA